MAATRSVRELLAQQTAKPTVGDWTPEYQRQCAGKVRHATRRDALDAIRRTRRPVGERRTNQLHDYWCRFCDGWHLGRHHVHRTTAAVPA